LIRWERILKENQIGWLLEKENPSVKYFTLRDILDKNENEPQVQAAKHAISESPVVKKILQKQKPDGYWEEPMNPYHPKYKSSYWTIMTLAQMGMDKADERIRKACEYIFQFQSVDGAFSSYTHESALKEHEQLRQKGKKLPPAEEYAASLVHEHEYSCLTGNMAAALIRVGYTNDSRVEKALQWLVEIQNEDGGWLCPYWRAHVRDKHGCIFGTICPIEAFSVANKELLTDAMQRTVEKGAEFLLMHRLFKADHHNYRVIKQQWLTLNFPLFCGYSILRGLDVLTRLGYVGDERMNDAIDVLLQKRQKDGTWILESSPAGRMQTKLESVGKSSKWVTLVALRILKRLSSAS
jgi:hypothetical protein